MILSNPRKSQHGLSLLELVITIIILSIIIIPISNFVSTSFSVFIHSKDNNTALSKLRYLNDRLSKEIRMIDHNGINFDITNMLNNQLTYFDYSGNRVDFIYNSIAKTLSERYTIPVATGILSDQVDTFSFNYYLADGITSTTSTIDIVFVEFVTTISEGNASYSATGRIMLRDRQ